VIIKRLVKVPVQNLHWEHEENLQQKVVKINSTSYYHSQRHLSGLKGGLVWFSGIFLVFFQRLLHTWRFPILDRKYL